MPGLHERRLTHKPRKAARVARLGQSVERRREVHETVEGLSVSNCQRVQRGCQQHGFCFTWEHNASSPDEVKTHFSNEIWSQHKMSTHLQWFKASPIPHLLSITPTQFLLLPVSGFDCFTMTQYPSLKILRCGILYSCEVVKVEQCKHVMAGVRVRVTLVSGLELG